MVLVLCPGRPASLFCTALNKATSGGELLQAIGHITSTQPLADIVSRHL